MRSDESVSLLSAPAERATLTSIFIDVGMGVSALFAERKSLAVAASLLWPRCSDS